jgi:Protein of unknown function DUF2617
MLVDLLIGYCDTNAEELGWSLDLGLQPALATRRIHVPPFELEIRLLGASHQVAVRWARPGARRADSSDPFCLETVACIPRQTTALPAEAVRDSPRWSYAFESAARTVDAGEFDRTIARLEAGADRGLVGRYPGECGALTAVLTSGGGRALSWTTWHTYPQDRRIVTTESRLELR